MIDRERVLQILSDTERHNAERTESTSNMDKFCQAICAFANDLSGSRENGYLIIGAKDNGELSGLKVDDNLLLKISNIRTDGNILPQPSMSVDKMSFEGGDVLVVEVQPSEFPPVRYRGRVWVRVGPRKSIASEAEEKILTERRLSNIRTFDAMPCLGTSIDDLDQLLIRKEFLPKAVPEEILHEDKRDITVQLASFGLYDLRYHCPTHGAIILFGRNPERHVHGAYTQYVRFKGIDRSGEILNEHKFSGSLCKVLPKIDAFIETSISQKRPIPVSVLREETVSKYPYWATRELLMNAIMHRDYEGNSPVQFYEYDNRIEIQNPGGLYGKVTRDNFPDVNDYRNPFIAEAMKVLGYVNRFSRGVYRVRKELEENGNGEALFDFSLTTAFRVVENVSQKYLDEGFGGEFAQVTPKKLPRNSQKGAADSQETSQETVGRLENSQESAADSQETSQESTRKLPGNLEEAILAEIRREPQVTRRDMAKRLNVTEGSIQHHLRRMLNDGVIRREGSTKAGTWVIVEPQQ